MAMWRSQGEGQEHRPMGHLYVTVYVVECSVGCVWVFVCGTMLCLDNSNMEINIQPDIAQNS